jgi:Domain of unknown function (DUF4389)
MAAADIPANTRQRPGRAPVRLVLSDDLKRKRLTVGFRWLLVIPHFIWLGLWGIAAFVAAMANWLVTLVTGRPPEALHRFLALYVKYATQVYGYFLLGADPYPPFDGRPGYPVDVEIDAPAAQSRLTVAVRIVLVLPALLLAGSLFGLPTTSSSARSGQLYYFSFGVAHVAALLGWFVCVARARMPRGLRDCVVWGVGFGAQLWAYLLVLTSAYPDPDPAVVLGELPRRSDPIGFEAGEDLRRSRLTVFFRLPLAVPHLVWLALWSVLALLAAIANWVATLVRGRSPAPLHRFLSAYLRYQAHVYAFLWLIGNRFPGFAGTAGSYDAEASIAPPRAQNRWSVAFRLVLVLPAWFLASAFGSLAWTCAFLAWFAALVTGRMPRGLQNASAQALRYTLQVSGYLLVLNDAYPYSGPCRQEPAGATAPAESAIG